MSTSFSKLPWEKQFLHQTILNTNQSWVLMTTKSALCSDVPYEQMSSSNQHHKFVYIPSPLRLVLCLFKEPFDLYITVNTYLHSINFFPDCKSTISQIFDSSQVPASLQFPHIQFFSSGCIFSLIAIFLVLIK